MRPLLLSSLINIHAQTRAFVPQRLSLTTDKTVVGVGGQDPMLSWLVIYQTDGSVDHTPSHELKPKVEAKLAVPI